MSPNAAPRRRALTLWPEWSWAICDPVCRKDRENRDWEPPPSLVGDWLAIHAGKYIGGRPGDSATVEGLTDLRQTAECIAEERGESWQLPCYSELIPRIVTSAVVAVVRVAGVEHGPENGWYTGQPGFGWVLDRLKVLPKPVPCKGAQGLWWLPDEVLRQVREQLGNRSAGSILREGRPHAV